MNKEDNIEHTSYKEKKLLSPMSQKETENNEFPKMLGSYQLLRSIGKGGMGEIFLAKDPICERTIALKKIIPHLFKYETIKMRFLNEAKIASQLAHPSIIPIYVLHIDAEQIYYTMPYIEGDTLKEILKQTREKEKMGGPPHSIGSSIPSLIQIFLRVCQAMDYTHSKGFLHRDLKPENIIVGKFGEVVILDWGIAHPLGVPEEGSLNHEQLATAKELTRPGKVVGTLGYMPPERALGGPSTIKTDIYSLGVILYQLLTLRLPFVRTSLQEFRKNLKHERLLDPEEIAPHRDIPLQLSLITKKCLSIDPALRYDSVHEIIKGLMNYIEGHPEWIPTVSLNHHIQKDWEFQENVLLAKHRAITRISSVMEWVMLMISKDSYSGNTKIETTITIQPSCLGIGFFMCIPEPNERKGLEDGYCLWLGSTIHPGCKLFRSNVEVMNIPEIGLESHRLYHISIEKIENNFRLFLDDSLLLNYVSHIPLIGGHIGLLYRDADFTLGEVKISLGSQNVMVNCLSVPDAFLTSKNYKKALSEYRRIAYSFRGRAEGREALFRAGLTLLEEAKKKKEKNKKSELFTKALDEFEKLHNTPGAPLEYLGKSLVYRGENNLEEEIKCLELAIRKFPKHPLLPVVEEHIRFRLHETSKQDRQGAYSFVLLALRQLPQVLFSKETQDLIDYLTSNWENLPFIESFSSPPPPKEQNYFYAIQLAFWLTKTSTLYEIAEQIRGDFEESPLLFSNIFFSLLELENFKLLTYIINHLKLPISPQHLLLKNYFEVITKEGNPFDSFFSIAPKKLSSVEIRTLRYLFEKRLKIKNVKDLLPYFAKLDSFEMEEESKQKLEALHIFAHLLAGDGDGARKKLDSLPQGLKSNTTTPFYLLYGCYLVLNKEEKAASTHFTSILDVNFPPTTTLLSHYIKGKISLNSGWIKQAFFWEKIQLYRQLTLYYVCLGDMKKGMQFEKMVEKEYLNSQITLHFI